MPTSITQISFAPSSHGIGGQPNAEDAPDTTSAMIINFSEYTTAQLAVGSVENACIQALSHEADTDNVVLVSKSNQACPCPEQITDEQVVWDCDHLTAGQLREKYPREYNSHRNMKTRCKGKDQTVHPDFMTFPSFLRHMKAMPANKATVDRINNADPEYAPGKVRWADKHTQNNNKSDLLFYDAATGKSYTVAQLATKHGVKPDTIRRRRDRHWTDQQNIAGTRALMPLAKQMPPTKAHGPIFWKPGAWMASWEEKMKIAKQPWNERAVEKLRNL